MAAILFSTAEPFELKFCKYLLKVKSSTCNMGVHGELERYPLYVSRYTRIVKFWCHIINTDNILVNYIVHLWMPVALVQMHVTWPKTSSPF